MFSSKLDDGMEESSQQSTGSDAASDDCGEFTERSPRSGSAVEDSAAREEERAQVSWLRKAAVLLVLVSLLVPLTLLDWLSSNTLPALQSLVISEGDSWQQLWATHARRQVLLALPAACGMAFGLSAVVAPKASLSGVQWCRSQLAIGRKVAWVLLIIAVFMAVGPALTVLNKNIMQRSGFPYPLALASQGLVAATVLTQCAARTGKWSLRQETRDYLREAGWFRVSLPIGVARAVTLAAGNAVYLHLGLGFIQMLKAFTPAIVVLVMRLLRVQSPSRVTLWFVSLIIGGGLLLVHGELNMSLYGICLMLTSEVTEAFSLVLTQRLLQNMSFTTAESLYVLAPPGAACLLLFAACVEGPRMFYSGDYMVILRDPGVFVAAALLGFFVNFISFELVQATSSLTYKVLNVVRCVGLVVIGVLFYGEIVTTQEVIGYSISLLGFLGYNWTKLHPQAGAQLETRVLTLVDHCCCRAQEADATQPLDLEQACAFKGGR